MTIKIIYEGHCIEVSEEVSKVLEKTDRKIKYFEKDLKEERCKFNKNGVLIAIIPSREDSIERLQEENSKDFSDDTKDVETIFFRDMLHRELHNAISQLSIKDQKLIKALFFEGKTEEEYGKTLGVTQQSISKKKQRIIKKLKNLLNF